MKTGLSLQELAAEIERRASTKKRLYLASPEFFNRVRSSWSCSPVVSARKRGGG